MRDWVDSATAEYIVNQLPAREAEREAVLDELLDPVIAAAVIACRVAGRLEWGGRGGETAPRAPRLGLLWIGPVPERAEALARRAAELVLVAHVRAGDAEGVAHAIWLAGASEAWAPRNVHVEAEDLFAFVPAAG